MSSEPEVPPGVDSYEAAYMKADGAMLRREKTLWNLHWVLLLPQPLLLFVLGMILSGAGSKPAPMAMALLPVALSGLFALLWLMFRALRVHVTERKVHIQYGIFGPQIPVEAIRSCKVVDYELTRYGGWGIRMGLDGSWAYTLAGDSAQVVEITWEEGGKTKKVVVSSLAPAALAASIEQARSRLAPRLRAPGVEGTQAPTVDEEALLAEEEAKRPGRRSSR
ncbi:MAG: hypothetical protein MUF64_16310 [Polyangiaceae bacterium]|jgi:hypothetical protein|nr:hypothetical protein [Polyangiaceae bacterium]